jgi:hypothetical protein
MSSLSLKISCRFTKLTRSFSFSAWSVIKNHKPNIEINILWNNYKQFFGSKQQLITTMLDNEACLRIQGLNGHGMEYTEAWPINRGWIAGDEIKCIGKKSDWRLNVNRVEGGENSTDNRALTLYHWWIVEVSFLTVPWIR